MKRSLGRWLCVAWVATVALRPLTAIAQSDPGVELERKRLDAVVRELDQDARVEAAFASAREVMQEGPVRVKLADQAVLALPRGDLFVPAAEAAAILRAWGSRPGADMLGMVLPGDEKPGNWFVVLHFNPAGFIADDEAKRWSADALLAQLKDGARQASAAGAQGPAEPRVLGWIEPPRYDATSRKLVWSIAAANGKAGRSSANYNTYSLGREGYISMNLVCDASEVDRIKPAVKELLAGLRFRDGKRYDDFNVATDRVASHGLTELIAPSSAAAKRTDEAAGAARVPARLAIWAAGTLGVLLAGAAWWWVRRKRGAFDAALAATPSEPAAAPATRSESPEATPPEAAEMTAQTSPSSPINEKIRRIS